MKTIALTGATSMTGLALIRQCITNNVNVIAFVRPNSNNLQKLPASNLIKLVECNLENINNVILPDSCLKADVFYHIGWINNTKEKRNSCTAQAENIQCSIATVNLAKKMECAKYIFMGSQAEVGLTHEPINQNSFINPISANGVVKYAAGKLTYIECEALGLDHVWVRLVSAYGPNDHADRLIIQFIKHCRDNTPIMLGECTQIWDYIHEDDVGNALFLIGMKGRNGKIYALGSGKGRPLKEYLNIIIKKLNPNYIPNYGAVKNTEKDISFLVADILDITNDTEWQPAISFENGIDTVIKEH